MLTLGALRPQGYIDNQWSVSSREDFVAPPAEAFDEVVVAHRRTKDAISLHAEQEHRFKALMKGGKVGDA